jgi:UDP-glucose 4-epimerase
VTTKRLPLLEGNRGLLRQVFNDHTIDAVIHFAVDSLVGLSVTEPQRLQRKTLTFMINQLSTMSHYEMSFCK